MEISSAVSQVYINDEGIDTLVCANNFFSFLAPDEQVSSYLELTFVNCKGVIIFLAFGLKQVKTALLTN